ncbi:hypothetical protein DN525_31150, partial [Burkholderia multivorans]|uniref:hypothetical protein n=1 Tax=Burkholderia multivorans TaxID=87883 RepID=UPI000DB1CC16
APGPGRQVRRPAAAHHLNNDDADIDLPSLPAHEAAADGVIGTSAGAAGVADWFAVRFAAIAATVAAG